VAIEPFGGFKLSGTGPKAGGKHYLYSLHQLNENPLELMSIKVDESSKSEVVLKKPSRLNAHSRTERMIKFLDNFSSLFESYYQGISTGHKEVLKDFSKWINRNYVSFATKEHKNRVIPGQISFNDFSKSCEHVLVISTTPRPDIKTLVQIFSAILSGTGVTIFCRNKESYNFWNRIYAILLSSGFSKDNIEVFISDSKNLETIINHPKLSVIIFDGSINDYQSQVINYLVDSKYDQRIKNILTNSDGIKSNDFYHQLLVFVWVRSFAVNTMRHGAPLELDL
jgi:RHH-type proline utilization regulon transcriptional repressor/proline dehydrogenase/delta 1-pyrroline-5-carboxylate dehydrogenase